jgi:hypothetical protein
MKWARCQTQITTGDKKYIFYRKKTEGKGHFEDLDADGKLILQ